mgnify:CR=1 FL=1
MSVGAGREPDCVSECREVHTGEAISSEMWNTSEPCSTRIQRGGTIMSDDPNEISLKEAGKDVTIYEHWLVEDGEQISQFKPGAEAEATLEAMLSASRRGKTLT